MAALSGVCSSEGRLLCVAWSGMPFTDASVWAKVAASTMEGICRAEASREATTLPTGTTRSRRGSSAAPVVLDGEAPILEGRVQLLYRGVGRLLVIAAVPAHGPVFRGLALLDDTARMVSAMFKGGDVSEEKVKSRYVEVYASLSVAMGCIGGKGLAAALIPGYAGGGGGGEGVPPKRREGPSAKTNNEFSLREGYNGGRFCTALEMLDISLDVEGDDDGGGGGGGYDAGSGWENNDNALLMLNGVMDGEDKKQQEETDFFSVLPAAPPPPPPTAVDALDMFGLGVTGDAFGDNKAKAAHGVDLFAVPSDMLSGGSYMPNMNAAAVSDPFATSSSSSSISIMSSNQMDPFGKINNDEPCISVSLEEELSIEVVGNVKVTKFGLGGRLRLRETATPPPSPASFEQLLEAWDVTKPNKVEAGTTIVKVKKGLAKAAGSLRSGDTLAVFKSSHKGKLLEETIKKYVPMARIGKKGNVIAVELPRLLLEEETKREGEEEGAMIAALTGLVVRVHLPKGTQLVAASPRAAWSKAEGTLEWQMSRASLSSRHLFLLKTSAPLPSSSSWFASIHCCLHADATISRIESGGLPPSFKIFPSSQLTLRLVPC